MPTDAERLAQMNEWLERERAANPKLVEDLLSGIPNALFGPEPKRVSIEHWKLIEEKANNGKPNNSNA